MLLMKTPTNIGGNNLITWLQTATEIRMTDLYTITLKSGTVLRYTTWDQSLPVLGNKFLTGPPNIERTAIEEKTGLDVATIEVVIRAGLSDLVSGAPILQAIGQGLWDGAAFRADRLFMDSSGNQIGTLIRFSGVVGPVDELTRSYAKLTVNAGTQYLTLQLPPIIMQPNCTHTLFDAGCTLIKANFAESNIVQGGSTVNKLISLSAKADGYYDNGQILFTSGPNNGLLKAVKQYFAKDFFFNSPLPFAPNAGDAFTAYPGDDKTQSTCQNKFNNLSNFGGFPYVPVPETAI
jgi:uncharacterized phage protein (TIGR02218 family)